MRTHGWTTEFRERSWDEIASFLDGMSGRYESFAHMSAIAHSVIDSGCSTALAGITSMHDIVVTSTPVPEPPLDVVIVRAPSSLRRPRAGHVVIEQRSLTGHDDRIETPVDEAVPLFWRFMIEKFGVEPDA